MASNNSFIGEILHFNAVRLRVNGSGNLKQSLLSLDEVNNQQLTPIVMQSATNTEPTTLANFIEQRAKLRIETTEKDEIFTVSKMIVFVKPFGSENPR